MGIRLGLAGIVRLEMFFVASAVLGIDGLVDGFMGRVEIFDQDGSDCIAEFPVVFG